MADNYTRGKEEGNERSTIVTQISVGGFGSGVTAKHLANYLEGVIGIVWRCRLKTSWTPPESYPNFDVIATEEVERVEGYKKVEPHAFVHFATPGSVTEAMDAAGRSGLFFNGKPLKVSLGPETPYRMKQRRKTTVPFKLSNVCVEIGTLANFGAQDYPDLFYVAWRGPTTGVDFLVDPFDGTCKFCFTRDTAFSFKSSSDVAVVKCDFKMEFLVRDINVVKQYSDRSHLVLLLQLSSSPRIWYRTADDDIEVSVPFDMLDDDDPWIRCTDFTTSGAIGKCYSYRISIPPRYGGKLKSAMDYFKQQRVQEESPTPRRPLKIEDEPDFGFPMSDPFFCIHQKEGISFEILFLVNAVMHKGIFNKFQLSEEFFDLLRNQNTEVNVAALKAIYNYRKPAVNACRRLKVVQEWLRQNPKLYKSDKKLADHAEIRRLIITPTRAYCIPPEVELSNRILRKYKDVDDQFLRITFTDEGMQKLNSNVMAFYVASIVRDVTNNSFRQKTRISERVKSILSNGFFLCGREYSFLAFSSNQLRDRSAWFFAEDKNLKVADIKTWMGKFTNRNIAKCAARMGQCFSSTYATVVVPQKEVDMELEDIERNGYTFSDGIGIISPDLAKEVANKMSLGVNQPSAFQIRYAGCKGVVACWPTRGNKVRLSLRPSMNKFQSPHDVLEICSWTRFQPGFLNRQIITLLSGLNVPDEMFWNMQETMVSRLNGMLEDTDVAFDVLTTSCNEQGNTAALMLSAGFKPQTEPHLRGMLMSVRASQLWGLREKARIFVPQGRWLMGCLDESGVLEEGQCFVQVSSLSLENCFAKHGSRFSHSTENLQVVRGFVVIAKNPCLHPGDIRILEAVDAPGLQHLHDCVIFPQNGKRPHTDECSGSDLDGDLYFVTWDENIIPPSKKSCEPMRYDAGEPKILPRMVRHQDIIDFFSRNMMDDQLGTICNAHVVHADLSEDGAFNEKCIKLAELAAVAVDFPKTGMIVSMPFDLKPKHYPDFMGKEDFQSYKSTKILGRLYRHIKDACLEDMSESVNSAPGNLPYDSDLEVSGSEKFIADAWEKKCSYDSQLIGMLGQYNVKREEEIVTGCIWSMPKYNSRKRGDLIEKLKQSYTALKKEFRQEFESLNPGLDELSDEEKNMLYEQKASAWYQVTYNPEWVKKPLEMLQPDDDETALMLSFPWVAADYLVRIKIKQRKGKIIIDETKPVNSLAKYLVDRM